MMAFEEGPFTTDFERLVAAGVELPEPESMDDTQLTSKLSEMIACLARLQVFLSQTDHLSDRDLYAHLWHTSLREEIPEVSDEAGVWHLDLLMSGSAEDTHTFLKFYADERARRDWLQSFPDEIMPAHEEPPYNRDARLPKP